MSTCKKFPSAFQGEEHSCKKIPLVLCTSSSCDGSVAAKSSDYPGLNLISILLIRIDPTSVNTLGLSHHLGFAEGEQEKGLRENLGTSIDSQGRLICHEGNNECDCMGVNIPFVNITASWSLVRTNFYQK